MMLFLQRESVRESLKNMLLVMNTTGLFDGDQRLTVITKDRLHSFLPGLWEEVFKMSAPPLSTPTSVTSAAASGDNAPSNEPVPAPPTSE